MPVAANLRARSGWGLGDGRCDAIGMAVAASTVSSINDREINLESFIFECEWSLWSMDGERGQIICTALSWLQKIAISRTRADRKITKPWGPDSGTLRKRRLELPAVDNVQSSSFSCLVPIKQPKVEL